MKKMKHNEKGSKIMNVDTYLDLFIKFLFPCQQLVQNSGMSFILFGINIIFPSIPIGYTFERPVPSYDAHNPSRMINVPCSYHHHMKLNNLNNSTNFKTERNKSPLPRLSAKLE